MKLRKLGPEPWGDRLARAREEAGFGLKEVAARLPMWITRSTLSDLEHRVTPPERPKDRARVVLCLVLYGVDPTDFGLALDDVPPETDLIVVRDLAIASSRCIALPALPDAA